METKIKRDEHILISSGKSNYRRFQKYLNHPYNDNNKYGKYKNQIMIFVQNDYTLKDIAINLKNSNKNDEVLQKDTIKNITGIFRDIYFIQSIYISNNNYPNRLLDYISTEAVSSTLTVDNKRYINEYIEIGQWEFARKYGLPKKFIEHYEIKGIPEEHKVEIISQQKTDNKNSDDKENNQNKTNNVNPDVYSVIINNMNLLFEYINVVDTYKEIKDYIPKINMMHNNTDKFVSDILTLKRTLQNDEKQLLDLYDKNYLTKEQLLDDLTKIIGYQNSCNELVQKVRTYTNNK